MVHNTFTLSVDIDGHACVSHNFPGCVGRGSTPVAAQEDMVRKIIYYKDNDPIGYAQVLKKRKQMGLYCMCGHGLGGDRVIGIAE